MAITWNGQRMLRRSWSELEARRYSRVLLIFPAIGTVLSCLALFVPF